MFAHPERFTEDRVLSYVRIDYDEEGQPSGRLLSCEQAADEAARGLVDGVTSIWHRIEEWLRRLAGSIGLEN